MKSLIADLREAMTQPFQGCGVLSSPPRVARTSQPWADCSNRFAVRIEILVDAH